jgi:hypothetical protein
MTHKHWVKSLPCVAHDKGYTANRSQQSHVYHGFFIGTRHMLPCETLAHDKKKLPEGLSDGDGLSAVCLMA